MDEKNLVGKLMRRLQHAAQEASQEGPVLKILNRLSVVTMTLETLQTTGIGKLVNGLRKWEGPVGETARQLVKKWKQLIPEAGSGGEGGSPQKGDKQERHRVPDEGRSENCSNHPTHNVERISLETYRMYHRHKSERCQNVSNAGASNQVDCDPNTERSERVLSRLRPQEPSPSGSDPANPRGHHSRHRTSHKHHRHKGAAAKSQSQPNPSNHRSGPVTHHDGHRDKPHSSGSGKTVDSRHLTVGDRGTKSRSLSPSVQPHDVSNSRLSRSTTPQSFASPNDPVVPMATAHVSPKKRKAVLDSASDAVAFSKRSRTQVYSGKKTSSGPQAVPSLFDISMRILLDNIDAIEEVGGVPYMIMEPVLQKCTPTQLMRLEEFNPHFLEESDVLWEKHCQKEFKGAGHRNEQTWKELYLDKVAEREEKLKTISANIKARKAAREEPLRQAKLAMAARVPSRRGGPRAPPIPARPSLMNRMAFNRSLEKPGCGNMSPLMKQTMKMAKERKLMMAAKPGRR